MKKFSSYLKPKQPASSLIYVFRCPMCNKTFHRVANSPVFKSMHKDRNGYPCAGIPVFETTKTRLL
jgi:hypothetical protein